MGTNFYLFSVLTRPVARPVARHVDLILETGKETALCLPTAHEGNSYLRFGTSQSGRLQLRCQEAAPIFSTAHLIIELYTCGLCQCNIWGCITYTISFRGCQNALIGEMVQWILRLIQEFFLK